MSDDKNKDVEMKEDKPTEDKKEDKKEQPYDVFFQIKKNLVILERAV